MATGSVHEVYLRRGWILVLPLGMFLFVLSRDFFYIAFLYGNFVLCDFIDPDADLMGLTKAEGDFLRLARRFYLGIFASLFVSYWFVYAYVVSVGAYWDKKNPKGIFGRLLYSIVYPIRKMFRGHRSMASHGFLIGTLGRMTWFNIPVVFIMSYLIKTAISDWGHPSWDIVGWNYFYMNAWMKPYLITQFTSWLIADSIHLILDTEWAKGRLYGFSKFGDLRNSKIERILKILNVKDEDVDAKKTKKSKSRRRKR